LGLSIYDRRQCHYGDRPTNTPHYDKSEIEKPANCFHFYRRGHFVVLRSCIDYCRNFILKQGIRSSNSGIKSQIQKFQTINLDAQKAATILPEEYK